MCKQELRQEIAVKTKDYINSGKRILKLSEKRLEKRRAKRAFKSKNLRESEYQSFLELISSTTKVS